MELSLDRKRLDLTFLFCLLLTLLVPSIWPSLRLSFFAPYLIITCYKKKLTSCLGLALLCGLIVDLLGAQARLGIHGLTFCCTLILLYPQKRNFFADSLTTLPIMTFLFAAISTSIISLLAYVLEMKNMLSWIWLGTDLLLMSAADAAFAFGCFILPAILFGNPRRRGKDYFLSQP